MLDKYKIELAADYFQKGYRLHLEGHIDAAIESYRSSIRIFPTARAHTCLGWAYSLQGKFEEAVEECLIAVELDPDYGNAYNDLGSYLFNLNRFEEALQWLEKAIEIPENENRANSYYNIGRIYDKKGEWFEALEYYNKAYELDPKHKMIKAAAIRLISLMN